MAKQTQTPAVVATIAAAAPVATAADTRVSKWSAELVRAQTTGDGTKAAHRFYKVADYLVAMAKPGQTVAVTFGQANEGTALARGGRGDAANSWALALQRTRQLFGGVLPMGVTAKVNRETLQIEISQPAA